MITKVAAVEVQDFYMYSFITQFQVISELHSKALSQRIERSSESSSSFFKNNLSIFYYIILDGWFATFT